MAQPTEPLEFVGAGGARLSGILHVPEGPVAGSALLAHCFTCSKDLHTSTRLARALSDGGYAVLRFDFTGLGESGGSFASTTVSTNIGDLSRAAVALLERGYGPCVLIGHSLGGAAALLAAHRLKTVTAVVTIGAPSDVEHVVGLFADRVGDIQTTGSALVDIGGRPFPIAQEFVDDLAGHSVLDAVRDLDRPLLVVTGSADLIVEPDNARRIHAAASEPKELVVIPGADHLLTDPEHARQVAVAVLDWLRRLEPPEQRR